MKAITRKPRKSARNRQERACPARNPIETGIAPCWRHPADLRKERKDCFAVVSIFNSIFNRLQGDFVPIACSATTIKGW